MMVKKQKIYYAVTYCKNGEQNEIIVSASSRLVAQHFVVKRFGVTENDIVAVDYWGTEL
jgi:hypothetical protein